MALDVGSLLQSCRRKRGREGEGKGSEKVRRGAQLYMKKKKSEEIVEGRREVVGKKRRESCRKCHRSIFTAKLAFITLLHPPPEHYRHTP